MADMKLTWLNWREVVLDTHGIGFGAKGMALYLGTLMEESGWCFPSLERICNDLEISRPTAIKYIKDLERVGLIERRQRLRKRNSYHATVPTFGVSS